MSLSVQYGNFVKSADTGVPVDQGVTGVGFQPKALLLWGNTLTAFGDSFGAHAIASIGVSDGTDDYSVASYTMDNQATSVARRRHASKVLTCFGPFGTASAECDLKSFDADGFTLTWTANNTQAQEIHYLALGGADLTNAKCATFTTDTALGDQAITGVGFKPDCVFTLAAMNGNTSPSPAPPSTETNASFIMLGVGAAYYKDGYSKDGIVLASCSEDGDSEASNAHIVADGAIIYILTYKAGAIIGDGQAALKSLDADGFTVTWVTAPSVATYMGYLAIKGGKYHVGQQLGKGSSAPGTKAYGGIGFPPRGILTLGSGAVPGGFASNQRCSVGAGTAAHVNGCMWWGGKDTAGGNTEADQLTKNNQVGICAYHGTPDLLEEGHLNSLDADGFTIDWTTTPAAQMEYQILSMGDAGSTVGRRIFIC